MSARMMALAFAATQGLTACKHIEKRVNVPDALQVSAVVVYPFGFRWAEPAYRATELSQRLLKTALDRARDKALFFGPSEFRVFRANEDAAWAASNVVGLITATGVSPHKSVVLRPWAEKRQATSQKDVSDSTGKKKGSAVVQETTYVGHVEVIHPSTRETLVEVTGEAQVDPFADHGDDPDPVPELTRLMTDLVRASLDALSDHLSPPSEPKDLSFEYVLNPQADTFAMTDVGKSELDLALMQSDPVEADVIRLGRVRYANPGLTDPEAASMSKLPGGLLVKSALPGKLGVGDIVHLIDGRPALPQVLERARYARAPVQVRVLRAGGGTEEFALP